MGISVGFTVGITTGFEVADGVGDGLLLLSEGATLQALKDKTAPRLRRDTHQRAIFKGYCPMSNFW